VRPGLTRAAAAAVAALAVAGCGATTTPSATTAPAGAHIVMTDARAGFAVWPSGVRWIVLATTDGWRTVQNRTPVAVTTDGGLVLGARGQLAAVGVLPYQQLTVSPVLRSAGTGRVWSASQLPSALAPTPWSLGRSERATYAVLADGSVLTSPDGSSTWSRLDVVGPRSSAGALTTTGVVFPDGGTGFVTATGPSDHPVLFSTADEGRTWNAVDLGVSGPGTAVALPPCLVGSTWVAPVTSEGRLHVFTARTPEGPWTAGPDLAAPGAPVVGCSSHRVWVAVHEGGSDTLATADPGGAWTMRGSLDAHLSSLAPVSDTEAYAAADDPSHVLKVTLPIASTATTQALALPDWVATVGGASMRN
jgi:hypothetical protein